MCIFYAARAFVYAVRVYEISSMVMILDLTFLMASDFDSKRNKCQVYVRMCKFIYVCWSVK